MYKALDQQSKWVFGNSLAFGRDTRNKVYLVTKTDKIRVKARSVCEFTGTKDVNDTRLYTHDVASYQSPLYKDRLIGVIYLEGDTYMIDRCELTKEFIAEHQVIFEYNKKGNSQLKG